VGVSLTVPLDQIFSVWHAYVDTPLLDAMFLNSSASIESRYVDGCDVKAKTLANIPITLVVVGLAYYIRHQ